MYRTLAFLAAAALVLALAPWPYGYYQLLRFGVTAVAAYGAYIAYGSGQQGWTWGLGGLAVLFNPIVPIVFEREVWAFFDVAAAVVLYISARRLPSTHST